MKCGIGSVEEISACIHQAIAAYDVVSTVWSFVTGGMIFMILQMWKRWNADVERLEGERDAANAKAQELLKLLDARGYDDYVAQIFDAVHDTVRNWHHDGVHRTPHIDKEKDGIARRTSPIPGEHQTQALIDLTNAWFGSMSNYVAVTYYGLYWPKGYVDWRTFVASDVSVAGKAVMLGDLPPIMAEGSLSAEKLGEMLASLHKALTPFFPPEEASATNPDAALISAT